MTDYALWTLGWLDGLVEKSSFPFHKSDYLCREFVNAAITHFFVANVAFTRFFLSQMSHLRAFLSRMSWFRAFWGRILRRIFGRNSQKYAEFWQKFCGKNWRVEPLVPIFSVLASFTQRMSIQSHICRHWFRFTMLANFDCNLCLRINFHTLLGP